MAKKTSKSKSKLASWLNGRPGHLLFGLGGLAIAYLFISFAIDSGSLLDYTIAVVAFVGGVREFVLVCKSWRKGKNLEG